MMRLLGTVLIVSGVAAAVYGLAEGLSGYSGREIIAAAGCVAIIAGAAVFYLGRRAGPTGESAGSRSRTSSIGYNEPQYRQGHAKKKRRWGRGD